MRKSITLVMSTVVIVIILTAVSCSGTKQTLNISEEEKTAFNQVENDTVTISSDVVEYEITITDPGFNTWLQTTARPTGYYSQSFLESRNRILVINWNQRVSQPFRFDPNLYLLEIDYSSSIDYGYDVNYKLYNYFVFFQRRNNQRLSGFLPRI